MCCSTNVLGIKTGVPKVCAAATWCVVDSEEGHHETILFTIHRNLNFSVRGYKTNN